MPDTELIRRIIDMKKAFVRYLASKGRHKEAQEVCGQIIEQEKLLEIMRGPS